MCFKKRQNRPLSFTRMYTLLASTSNKQHESTNKSIAFHQSIIGLLKTNGTLHPSKNQMLHTVLAINGII